MGPRYASGKQESKAFLSIYVKNYWHGCELKKQLDFLLKATRMFSIFHFIYVLIIQSFPDGEYLLKVNNRGTKTTSEMLLLHHFC